MKIQSAKAKGRRLAVWVRDTLLAHLPIGADDIRVTPSSVPGEDLWLSPAAKECFPFAVECKNSERLNIWAAIEQAKGHADGGMHVVFFARNRQEPYVALRASDFIRVVAKQSGAQ